MTILFFLKPYQFFDRGGVYKKHIQEAKTKRRKEEKQAEPEALQLKIEPVLDTSKEDQQKLAALAAKLKIEAEAEQLRIEQLKAQELQAKIAEEKRLAEEARLAREKAEREYREYQERLRLEAIERARIAELERIAREKAEREYQERKAKVLARREKIRIEREDREVFELIHVINQHLEDHPY